jgi:hypothetical protein
LAPATTPAVSTVAPISSASPAVQGKTVAPKVTSGTTGAVENQELMNKLVESISVASQELGAIRKAIEDKGDLLAGVSGQAAGTESEKVESVALDFEAFKARRKDTKDSSSSN